MLLLIYFLSLWYWWAGLIDEYVPTIEGVLGVADIVSLHLPLTPATYHMINDKRLQAMKQVN
jgi:phosphoglycerate dehydrogenase-like enzyme